MLVLFSCGDCLPLRLSVLIITFTSLFYFWSPLGRPPCLCKEVSYPSDPIGIVEPLGPLPSDSIQGLPSARSLVPPLYGPCKSRRDELSPGSNILAAELSVVFYVSVWKFSCAGAYIASSLSYLSFFSLYSAKYSLSQTSCSFGC